MSTSIVLTLFLLLNWLASAPTVAMSAAQTTDMIPGYPDPLATMMTTIDIVAPPPPGLAASSVDVTAYSALETSQNEISFVTIATTVSTTSERESTGLVTSANTPAIPSTTPPPTLVSSSAPMAPSKSTEASVSVTQPTTPPANSSQPATGTANPSHNATASGSPFASSQTSPMAAGGATQRDAAIISAVVTVVFVCWFFLGLWVLRRHKERKLAGDVGEGAQWMEPNDPDRLQNGTELRPITPGASDSPNTITGIEVQPPWSPIGNVPAERPFVIKRPRATTTLPPASGGLAEGPVTPSPNCSPSVQRLARKVNAMVAIPLRPSGVLPPAATAEPSPLSLSSSSLAPSLAATVIVTRRSQEGGDDDEEDDGEGDRDNATESVATAAHVRDSHSSLGSNVSSHSRRLSRGVRRRGGVEDLRGA